MTMVTRTGDPTTPEFKRFRPRGELIAATIAVAVPTPLLVAIPVADYLSGWSALTDHFVGLFLAVLVLGLGGSLLIKGLILPPVIATYVPTVRSGRPMRPMAPPVRWRAVASTIAIIMLCTLEWGLHADDRNPWLASSRPEANEDRWLGADGYAMLLDGHLAQNDGTFLLDLARTFLGEAPPNPGGFDRRAGHVYVVSMLIRPFGAYWGFATANLTAWCGAALAIRWLGNRLWPGTATGSVGAILVATGQGFIFTGTAPQAHAVAYGAFALLLVLSEQWRVNTSNASLTTWAKLGWLTGVAGLVYFVHLPFLLFTTLDAGLRRQWRGLTVVGGTTFAIVFGWQLVGNTIGLNFTGDNNDLSGEAITNWLRIARGGLQELVAWGHYSSPRGVVIGAFWLPWLVLAAAGWWVSPARARTWAAAVTVAGLAPALAFTTRFQLPRVAYFAYPAILLLAGASIATLSSVASRRYGSWAGVTVAGTILLGLAAVTNLDILTGSLRFAVDFHYAPGTNW
jgi:hypothetical protein